MHLSILAEYYERVYVVVLFGLCLFYILKLSFSTESTVIDNKKKNIKFSTTQIGAFILTVIIIIFIGNRPSSPVFVDMNYYAYTYDNIYTGSLSLTSSDSRGEWLFSLFGNLCKLLGFSTTQYFISIASIYYGLMLFSCWMLMRRNLLVAVLFCFISLSCFAYGVNGMRNGMACSFAMMAIALLNTNKWGKIFSILLMFIAFSLHRSTILPCFCAISALLFVKNTKWAIYFWGASILISLLVGNYVTEFFVNLGFDDRMESYANLDEEGNIMESTNVKSGFRVDFILYSIMPIIMAWYVTVKRNFKDLTYHVISITYILANSFWIMVIRSEQSNRFAYLSWFLYPIVIAYPLLRMNLWNNQDRKVALILFAYSGFTFFMSFVYYG